MAALEVRDVSLQEFTFHALAYFVAFLPVLGSQLGLFLLLRALNRKQDELEQRIGVKLNDGIKLSDSKSSTEHRAPKQFN